MTTIDSHVRKKAEYARKQFFFTKKKNSRTTKQFRCTLRMRFLVEATLKTQTPNAATSSLYELYLKSSDTLEKTETYLKVLQHGRKWLETDGEYLNFPQNRSRAIVVPSSRGLVLFSGWPLDVSSFLVARGTMY